MRFVDKLKFTCKILQKGGDMIEFKMKPVKHVATNIDDLRKNILTKYNHDSINWNDRVCEFRLTLIDYNGLRNNGYVNNNHVYYNHKLQLIRLISINNQEVRYEKIYFKSGKRKGELKEKKLIQKKEWHGFVYDIPVSMFKFITKNGQCRVVQHKHHFTIEAFDK